MTLELAVRYPDLSVIIADQYSGLRPLLAPEDYWTFQPGEVKTKEDLQLFAKAHTQLIYNTVLSYRKSSLSWVFNDLVFLLSES